MSQADSSLPPPPSPSPDYLPPPPRSVEPNLRAGWMRAGSLVGMMLGPLFVLWVGQEGAEDLRKLAAQGRSTTGQIVGST